MLLSMTQGIYRYRIRHLQTNMLAKQWQTHDIASWCCTTPIASAGQKRIKEQATQCFKCLKTNTQKKLDTLLFRWIMNRQTHCLRHQEETCVADKIPFYSDAITIQAIFIFLIFLTEAMMQDVNIQHKTDHDVTSVLLKTLV